MTSHVTMSRRLRGQTPSARRWTATKLVRAISERLPHRRWLPAAGLEELRFFDGCGGEALHSSGDLFSDLGENLRVVEVGGRDDDGFGARHGLFALLGRVLNVERSGALFH